MIPILDERRIRVHQQLRKLALGRNLIACLPYLTIIGALFLCFIELKSIFEKAEDKTRFAESALLAGKIIANKDDLKKLVEELGREKPEKETNDE